MPFNWPGLTLIGALALAAEPWVWAGVALVVSAIVIKAWSVNRGW